MTERSPLDAFKDVLSGTARSMARDMEVELAIGLREAGYGVWQA